MNELIEFIRNNVMEISTIVILMLFLLVIINIKGINLNEPETKSKLVQEITVETFDNETNDEAYNVLKGFNNDFCDAYVGESDALETACNRLTKKNCLNVGCCLLTNDEKCVASNKDGAIYK
jgi:hypothetical protein